MELKTKLEHLSKKFDTLKNDIKTEEATKNAFVMPFINALGYDIFNPKEVIPEYVADVGLKKGEKVDYAILINDQVSMIFECKHWKENLNDHTSQLHRYFGVSKTKFGVLTNGYEYRFYTDLVSENIMDDTPFFVLNLESLRDSVIGEVSKFHKESFDKERISINATTLKNLNDIKSLFSADINSPSSELVKYFISKTTGRATKKTIDQFTELIPKALNQIINEKVNDRLQIAISKEVPVEEEVVEESKIITTEEEMEGYRIVIAILHRVIDISRVTYRDTQSYFGVLLDDNNRKPICRLHFNAGTKYIGVFDENKNETRYPIEFLNNIYRFDRQIIQTAKQYLK